MEVLCALWLLSRLEWAGVSPNVPEIRSHLGQAGAGSCEGPLGAPQQIPAPY